MYAKLGWIQLLKKKDTAIHSIYLRICLHMARDMAAGVREQKKDKTERSMVHVVERIVQYYP